MQPSDIQLIIISASAFVGALGGTAGLGWWLATRFNNVYARIGQSESRTTEKIVASERLMLAKLDAHESLDAERFDEHKERFNKQDLAIMRVEMALQAGGTPLRGI